MPQIGVVTRYDDFHAQVIQRLLKERGITCSLLLADSVAWEGGLSWSLASPRETGAEGGVLRDAEGREVVIGDLDLVWWRRLTGEPRVPVSLPDDDARRLVVNDCQAALVGLFLAEFRGTWVSPPEATRLASNKLLQLKAAQQAGLRVPRTLVSQDPERIRAFCAGEKRLVVKPVAGAQDVPVATGLVTPELLTDEAVRVCPATYQEYIPGSRHLRISCFGEALHAVLLESEVLDWRYPLQGQVSPFALDPGTTARIRHVLAALGLRMGMVDMKLDEAGEPVWLEVNPQGQFMFLEGMCGGLSLSHHFCDFLIAEAEQAAAR